MTRHIGYPEPGFYKVRLVRKGPEMPCIIWEDGAPPAWLEDPPTTRTLVPGIGFLSHFIPCLEKPRDLLDLWPGTRPIPEAECRHLVADAEWQRDFAPHMPLANPLRPVERAGLDLEP